MLSQLGGRGKHRARATLYCVLSCVTGFITCGLSASSAAFGGGDSNCCFANGGLGCDDPACQSTVCAVDAFCCEVAWDEICANEAIAMCGALCASASCPASHHDCFTEGGAGCSDGACCSAVCAVDPFCCENSWDGICVTEAFAICGAPPCDHACVGSVEPEACGADTNGGCNSVLPSFGSLTCGETLCGTAWAFAGVRDTDWFEVHFDVATQITLTCSSQLPVDFGVVDTHDCATASMLAPFASTPFCGTATLDYCIPAGDWWIFIGPALFDGFVCGSGNNSYELTLSCGAPCGEPVCGDGICNGSESALSCPQDCDPSAVCPGNGACDVPHTEPACNDFLCCQLVCSVDPFCCEVAWDGICANEAIAMCIADTACPGACTGDLNGDGQIDGADLAILLGSWNTGDPCSDLTSDGIVNGADLAVVLGAWGQCAVAASPASMGFGQTRVGDSNTEGVAIVNRSAVAAIITGVTVPPGPYSVDIDAPSVLPPGGSTPLIVHFTPTAIGVQTATIFVHVAGGPSIPVTATGEGIPDQDSPPDQWLDVFAEEVAIERTAGDLVIAHYQLNILPRGPVSFTHDASSIEVSVAGVPPGVSVGMAVTNGPFGFAIYSVQVLLPPGGIVTGDRVNLLVTVRNTQFEVLTAYLVNIPLQPPPPPAPPCTCSPPAMLSLLDHRTDYFPDSPIPASDTGPGATPDKVAQILMRIDGPKPGECCTGADSKFVMKATISADFAAAGEIVDRNHTAHTLIRACRGLDGMSITAKTCGIEHPITSAPASSLDCAGVDELPEWGEPIGNIVLQTTWTTPIKCALTEPWPCIVEKNDHLTEILFNGAESEAPGSGGIQIHWRVEAGGTQCKLQPSNAKFKRVLFLRVGDVYSPDRHAAGWLNKSADPDGDGRNNHRELYDGTNPNVAD